jgi:hypothetical protein
MEIDERGKELKLWVRRKKAGLRLICSHWCASETGESCGMKGIHHVNYPFSM